MDYTGLISRYRNNRPLTDEERALQLKPGVRLDVEPRDQLALIKINSSFLDSVDRWFGARGFIAVLGLIFIVMSSIVIVLMLGGMATGRIPNMNGLWEVSMVVSAGFFLMLLLGVWMARVEFFAWTHYPIRVDREHRLVHVFQRDGSVKTFAWDNLFFTVGRGKRIYGVVHWDLRAMLLDADGQTVRDTFAFAVVGDQQAVQAHWEFLRRYVEEGPREVVPRVPFFMPVDGKRESLKSGLERVFANDGKVPALFFLAALPFNLTQVLVRWLVMRSCRIPVWPGHIEAATPVPANDPWKRDASRNPTDLR